jgi:hypothetical protein
MIPTAAQMAMPRTRAEQVEAVADLRRTGRWNGRMRRDLAEQWGVSRGTLEAIAAEAGRVVAREVADPDGVTADVGVMLRRMCEPVEEEPPSDAQLERLSRAGGLRAVYDAGRMAPGALGVDAAVAVRAAEAWARIAGAMAPQRHVVAQEVPVTSTEEWTELRTVLLAALEPHPEAHAAVVAALEEHARSRPREGP